jgi:ligand-binding sensor domain-containing protein/signal transduction histidine kinase
LLGRLCAVLWLLAVASAGAQVPAPQSQLSDWLIHLWQTEHGLPQNAVTSVLQSRSGYLWIGTFNGVARFDGVDFTVFNPGNTPALRSGRVTSLFEDAEGTLWIGQDTGDLTAFRENVWREARLPDGWPGGIIQAMRTDSSGALWLLHPSGLLLRLHDGLVIPAKPGEAYGPLGFFHDVKGTLWLLRNQSLAVLKDGALHPGNPLDELGTKPVIAAAASARGGLWLLIEQRIRRWENGVWLEDLGEFSSRANDTLLNMTELTTGEVIVGTLRSGLHWFRAGTNPETLGRGQGLAHEWTRGLLEDREGNLWVATAAGLNRLRRRRAAMAPNHWRGAHVRAVAPAPAGDLWVGTEGAGLYHLQAGSLASEGPAPGIPESFIWSALVDPEGAVWAGTWGQGLLLRREDGSFGAAPGWPAEATIVTALYERQNGNLLVGTDAGLLERRDGEWIWIEAARKITHIRTMSEDAAGRLWCGMSGGGLARIQEGKVTVFRKKDGLPSDFVWTLDPEPDGSLWIGTFGGGLCRWKDNRFSTVTAEHGLPSNVICHLADEGPDYWISSYAGIFRVRKEALRRCADGKAASLACLSLTQSDGLETQECSGGFQPSAGRTADGRLWFPTAKGLAIIDPKRVHPQLIPPPVVIESVLIDEKPGDRRARVQVPPGQHRLEFRYTGLSFAAPERVRFRHRLVNLETDWVEAGALRTVTYNYLPPGRYTFEVLASNGDGVWSPRPASIQFTVQPQFWQTWWFRVLAAAGIAGLLIGTYRLRMHQLGEVERVRLRIARDLHDEVGANLGSIALLSGALEQQPNTSDAGEVRRIATRTVEMLKEVVWLTNPAHDRLSELVPRMREAIRQMLPRTDWEFVTDELPSELILPPAWRHHLLPILKEAIHNAARHAHAQRVRVVLRIARRLLELSVEDDGVGFDPEKVIPGDGLLNLQRRARDMDATLQFIPRPGGGTVVLLQVFLP